MTAGRSGRERLGRLAGPALLVGFLFAAPPSASADVPAFADELRAGFRSRLEEHTVRYIDLEEPRAEVAVAPRFVWIRDLSLSLPGPPWIESGPFLEAFDLARTVWERVDQPDDVKALVVFTSFDVGPTAPFYVGLANDTAGIGLPIFDDSPGSELEGLIWMGELRDLWEAGPEYLLEAFVHEIAHRWGVYVDVAHPELAPGALRGRQDRHWSFFVDSDNSPMDGNDWVREGSSVVTRFMTPHEPLFSPLDLYSMGHRMPSEVPPFEIVSSFASKSPGWVNVSPETLPAHRLDVTVRLEGAVTQTVTIEQILEAEGPRDPAVGPSEWPVGVVLLSAGFAGTANRAERGRFEDDLEAMIDAYERATDGAMRLRAETRNPGRGNPGDACLSDPDCNPARTDGCVPGRGQCGVICRAASECDGGDCCDGWCAPSGTCIDAGLRRDAGATPDGAASADAGLRRDAGGTGEPSPPGSCAAAPLVPPGVVGLWTVVWARLRSRRRGRSPGG